MLGSNIQKISLSKDNDEIRLNTETGNLVFTDPVGFTIDGEIFDIMCTTITEFEENDEYILIATELGQVKFTRS